MQHLTLANRCVQDKGDAGSSRPRMIKQYAQAIADAGSPCQRPLSDIQQDTINSGGLRPMSLS